MSLTKRQEREVRLALRHLGRAMKALDRARIPLPRDFVTSEYRLARGVELVAKASDALLDGIGAEPTEPPPVPPPA